jgi:hypothetical protein
VEHASQSSENPPAREGTWFLWAAVIGTPILWSIHLVLNYALVQRLCLSKRMWVMHVITLAFAGLAGVAMAVSAREWTRTARRKPVGPKDTEEISRAQFLAVLAVMVSTLFFMVILATGVPAFIIDPCAE